MDGVGAALALLQATHPYPGSLQPGGGYNVSYAAIAAANRYAAAMAAAASSTRAPPHEHTRHHANHIHHANSPVGNRTGMTLAGLLPAVNATVNMTPPPRWMLETPGTVDAAVTAEPLDMDFAQTWSFGSILVLIFSAVLVIFTVIGNVCVIVAVHQSKALQAPQNKLIVSLALADLLVGLAVMPFAAITDFVGKWVLGSIACDLYAVLDVWLCTSSILHLVAIAIDRYFSITNMRYIQGRSVVMMYGVLGVIWSVSFMLSVGPVFGWRDAQYMDRIQQGLCLISQDVSFQIIATMVAFYGPLVGILVLYGLIYQRTRSRVRKRLENTLHSTLQEMRIEKDAVSVYPLHPAQQQTPASTPSSATAPPIQVSTFYNGTWVSRLKLPHRKRTVSAPLASVRPNRRRKGRFLMVLTEPAERARNSSTQTNSDEQETPPMSTLHQPLRNHCTEYSTNGQACLTASSGHDLLPPNNPEKLAKKTSSNMSIRHQTLLKREKKAATTLAIITLSFVICWLPFFVYALVRPTCGDSCLVSTFWEAFFLWLGYVNSTLNPVIYTIFSPDFRAAFKKMFRLEKR
ncbi:5-hydroxytryptamine receptor-like isoform X2 [Paramacrobiotus metropolitanus]|nr:5-hydroxytryptamine receptor-like isoform X2 [Paramacrobiotus metropolitanus]XP_055330635.1 5-hydroxytryptamine receptor-like isoform X2 [Paramacrobiotus metropolitanus]XP_055330636.1 5-hydroxytryptamine receptor-like isoform X2 [Paramacrobiotus metropolitanus]